MPDGKNLLIAANDQTTTGVWIQPLDGPAKRVNLGKLIASASYGLDASLSRDGHAAMVASETQRPNELFYMDSLTSKPERLTDFNAPIAALELGRTETVDWDFEGFKEDGAVIAVQARCFHPGAAQTVEQNHRSHECHHQCEEPVA